ncbi:MAG: hypothetical protein WBO77_04465 [Microgenomates group bacterium]
MITKADYIEKMKGHREAFNDLWMKIVSDTNEYIESNPDTNMDTVSGGAVEYLTHDLCLSGAWIIDRLNDRTGITGDKNYKYSLTKKIRKALGYTL